MAISSRIKWLKRKKRVRRKLKFSFDRPRLTVFKSSKHIYGQIIDDYEGKTLVYASSLEKSIKGNSELRNKVDLASFVGKLIAERALEKGVGKVVFDRNGFFYHGRIRAFSEGARSVGLSF